jgi:hypothetical protein
VQHAGEASLARIETVAMGEQICATGDANAVIVAKILA